MTIEDHIAYLVESADRNFKTAEDLLLSGHYDWCLFISHLVLEKSLKALYVKKSANQTPPKSHNLLKLSELSNLELDETKKLFFNRVNSFNLETRYEEYKNEFYKIATKEFTETNFNLIKEYFIWLKSLIK